MGLDGGVIHNEGRKMDFPPSKSISPAPYKQQVGYIGNYTVYHNVASHKNKIINRPKKDDELDIFQWPI
jgi:hypothetical protein